MPVAAFGGVGERDHDDVADARGDFLVAPRAPVGLAGGERLDRAHLGGPAGEGIAHEHGADRPGTLRSRTCHEALSPDPSDLRADGRRFRYNVPVDSVTVGVRFRPASGRSAAAGADLAPAELVRLAMAAEQAGAQAVILDGARAPGAPADPFVLLGALAAATSRVVLGCVATAVGERHPAVLAKTVAALDVCSTGRALVCLRPSATPSGTGLDELAEALDVVRLMLDTPGPTLAGRHFAIQGAWNEPRARRATPTPLGVLVPAPGPTPGVSPPPPAELAACAKRHADCCFVEVAGGDTQVLREVSEALGTDGFPLVALVGVEAVASPAEVASAVWSVLRTPSRGVVVDWHDAPTPTRVLEVVAAVRGIAPSPV